MSTVSQRAWNRLTKHAFKRYRKGAVEVVQWAGANSRAHRQWCGYSIVPMRERLQRELDATSQPTAIRVFQIKPVPCMCRLLRASQGPGGDAQSGNEAGARCCLPVRFLEDSHPQIDHWAIRVGQFTDLLDNSEWVEQVRGVFRVINMSWQWLPAGCSNGGGWLLGGLAWPERGELPPTPPQPEADIALENVPSSEDVLNKLRDQAIPHEERRAWVVEAEALSFVPAQTEELGSLFAQIHRRTPR